MSTKTKPVSKVNLADIETGDIFSETSHYRFSHNDAAKGYAFVHLESGEIVHLTAPYVENLLTTGDQYNNEVMVGLEDKMWTEKQIIDAINKGELARDTKVRAGDVRVKGIRTLFEEIYSSAVFICCFRKQDTKLTKKELEALRKEQNDEAVALIEKARASKKSIPAAATQAIAKIQENPIMTFKPGEERVLRGFKVQFTSRDGRYDCVDMDIDTKKEPNNIRPVNINTLLWLVKDGVKYTVEK